MKNTEKQTISIVIPCFNEEKNIVVMYKKLMLLIRRIPKYNFEIIFIDNGSTDNTAQLITRYARQNKQVVGIFLSRNFGHESSTQAGLDYAKGDAVVLTVCDMQEPPEVIPKFIQVWESGCDIVLGVYKNAKEDLLMTFSRRLFYQLLKMTSSIEVPVNNTGFGLMSRCVIDSIGQLPEKYRFFRGLRSWVGFKTGYVTYTKEPRLYGKSSYNIYQYFRHAERSLMTFSSLPLSITMNFAVLSGVAGFIYGIFLIIQRVAASVIALVLLVSVLIITVGIIGKYQQIIFEETKNRPVYIIRGTLNTK